MTIKKEKKSNLLIILDGWGIAPPNKGNAVELAKKPFFNFLWDNFPHTQLQASGASVGLSPNVPGNSETGHFNLGAGRIVLDDGVFISQSIANKLFFQNKALLAAMEHAKKNKSRLHLMGLLTEKTTAHAKPAHLLALMEMAKKNNVPEVFLHLFADGRDTTSHSVLRAFNKIRDKLDGIKVASLIGRYYAMDRKKDWAKTEKAYNLLVLGEGKEFQNIEEAVAFAYDRSGVSDALLTDEYIPPSVFLIDKKKITIDDNDAVIFFNFRSDRARQLTKTFVQENFNKMNPGSFHRKKVLKNLCFVALTNFGPDLDDIKTAFPSSLIKNSLPIVLKNYQQIYMSEKEKYAHVTYFFNGGYDHAVAGEKRILVPSPVAESYETVPEMNAAGITENLIKAIKDKTDFITVNYPNPDVLGHTGNIEATVKAIEVLDKCLAKVFTEAEKQKSNLPITADHGNAEKMIELETGETYNGHTTNPVPFILVADDYKKKKLKEGILADVSPTILEIMEVEKPKEMTGNSLIN
jgi:2,3-bisphosphoglycerate-independent phosphoglycerate mutase